jgi:hypothetical protein
MNDLAKWKVHGPVQALRAEFAEWDPGMEQWQPPRGYSLVRFLPNGRTDEAESHDPDGSISRLSYFYGAIGQIAEMQFRINGGPISRSVYSYDDFGRIIRVVAIDPDGTERESEAYQYSQDGKKTKICFVPKLEPNVGIAFATAGAEQPHGFLAIGATGYNEGGQPDQILFHDAEHRLLRRITLKRDIAGRLVSEEASLGEQMSLLAMQPELENMPPKTREAVAAMFANLFHVSTYAYDHKGRLLERCVRTGDIGEHRATFRYDDRDNKIEQTIEDISREMRIDEEGKPELAQERSHRQLLRLEYKYDAQGNWTERVVWSRLEPQPDFQPSNVERREIAYYAV